MLITTVPCCSAPSSMWSVSPFSGSFVVWSLDSPEVSVHNFLLTVYPKHTQIDNYLENSCENWNYVLSQNQDPDPPPTKFPRHSTTWHLLKVRPQHTFGLNVIKWNEQNWIVRWRNEQKWTKFTYRDGKFSTRTFRLALAQLELQSHKDTFESSDNYCNREKHVKVCDHQINHLGLQELAPPHLCWPAAPSGHVLSSRTHAVLGFMYEL